MSTVGESIKRIRKRSGLTQKQLGEKCGMKQTIIAQYEHGRRTPKIETLQKIANSLGVPVSQIYGWDNHLNDSKASQIIVAKSILENAIDSDSYSVMHKAILEVYEILKELGANK